MGFPYLYSHFFELWLYLGQNPVLSKACAKEYIIEVDSIDLKVRNSEKHSMLNRCTNLIL